MGQALHYSLYGRNKSDDKYKELIKKIHGSYMSRFKHEIYSYCLGKDHSDQKSLYMYCGYYRVCKGVVVGDTLELIFQNKSYAEEWDRAEEQIRGVLVNIPWLERNFCQHWLPVVSDCDTKRIFKRGSFK